MASMKLCWRYWARLPVTGTPGWLIGRTASTADHKVPSQISSSIGGVVEVPGLRITADKSSSKEVVPTLPPFSSPVSYYLDTHGAVLKLQAAGYSAEQAEVVVKVLTQSVQSAVVPIERSVLSHQHLELAEVKILKELETVSNKLVLLEKTSLESLRKENDALKDRVEKLMNSFKDEVTKVQSNLQLDLNLEKGRIKEEATMLKQDVKDTNNRIDTEVAQIRTQIESQKLESFKYLSGMAFTVVTVALSVVLGLWRLSK